MLRLALSLAGIALSADLVQSQAVTATDRVRIRENPDFTSRTKAVTNAGDSLTIVADSDRHGFYHVRTRQRRVSGCDNLVQRFGTPASQFQRFPQPVPITITGVAFFDFPHGQIGHADNAIELHPVLDIQ